MYWGMGLGAWRNWVYSCATIAASAVDAVRVDLLRRGREIQIYYAHSTSDQTRSNWQPLHEHLRAVADLAGRFGQRLGIEKVARLAGLLHDLGKYTAEFQARLAGAAERVDHSTAGAVVVGQLAKGDDR